MDKTETLALKEIRRSIKDATECGDHARLDELRSHIDTTIAESSKEMAAALKALPLVRAYYRAESDEELLAQVREIGDEHGYDRAGEHEGDRGAEYVVDFANTEMQWIPYSEDDSRDMLAEKIGTTSARLDRIGWWTAYLAGLIAGYERRAAELAEPELTGWIVDDRGVTVRGRFVGNDFEPWGVIFRMAAVEITGIDDEEKANTLLDSVVAMHGQFDDGSELFPWSINGLEEVEYDGDGTGINALDLRDAALEAWEWPSYYKFEGGEALWFENNGRCAVAFNGNAIWTDAGSIEEGIGRVILGRVIA